MIFDIPFSQKLQNTILNKVINNSLTCKGHDTLCSLNSRTVLKKSFSAKEA